MRSRRLLMFVVPVLAVAPALLVAAPTAAQSTGVCSLVTRGEAGKLLRAKVVKTEKDESPANGA